MSDIKISRYFTKSFLGDGFNEKRYKEEYSALYKYLGESVIRLNKFNSDKPLTEEVAHEQMGLILEEVEKNARTLFEYYSVDFKEEYAYGGLSDSEREKIEKTVYKTVSLETGKKPKKLNIVNDVLGRKKYEDDFIKALKEDDILKNLDLSVFGEVVKIAQYTNGKLDEKTRNNIFEYVRSFSTEKKGYLYDSTYFYMERSGYKGRNIFEDIENEYKAKDVGAYYNLIAYYVDYFYDMYALQMGLRKNKSKDNKKVLAGEEYDLSEKLDRGLKERHEIKGKEQEAETDFELKLKNDSVIEDKAERFFSKEDNGELKPPEKSDKQSEIEIAIKLTK